MDRLNCAQNRGVALGGRLQRKIDRQWQSRYTAASMRIQLSALPDNVAPFRPRSGPLVRITSNQRKLRNVLWARPRAAAIAASTLRGDEPTISITR